MTRKLSSTAVMAQRKEPLDSLDDYPTPPWATRALMEYVIFTSPRRTTVLEPACGRGHMSKALKPYFKMVLYTDIHMYGKFDYVPQDFLKNTYRDKYFDWVITNPPFKLAEEFILKARSIAKIGVAMLTRTTFIESVGRYNRLFSVDPPQYIAQFSERVSMV